MKLAFIPSGNLREKFCKGENHIYHRGWKLMPWFWHVWLRISPSCLAKMAAHAKIFFDFFITRIFLQNAWWSILFHAGAILNKSRAEKSPTSLLLWQTQKNASSKKRWNGTFYCTLTGQKVLKNEAQKGGLQWRQKRRW